MDQIDEDLDDLENGLIDRVNLKDIAELAIEASVPALQEDYDEYNEDVTIGFANSELIDRYKDLPKGPEATDSYSDKEVSAALFRQGNSLYLSKKGYAIGKMSLSASDSEFNLKQSLNESNISEEDKYFFSSVVNREQFNAALEYLQQDKLDQEILSDTGFARRAAYGLAVGIADPLNWIPIGRMLKFGTPLVKTAIEGTVIGGLNASARGYVNSDIDVDDIAYGAAASGILTAAFGGAIKGTSALVKNERLRNIARDIKNFLSPDFEQWFSIENGEPYLSGSGAFGKFKEKIRTRPMWTAFNNSPESQMYYSGDTKLQRLSELIFRNRNGRASKLYTYKNKKGEAVTVHKPLPITAEEVSGLFAARENLMMQKINEHCVKYREEGGDLSQFYKEVDDSTINTYVAINTGEFYFGKLPEAEQIRLFEESVTEELTGQLPFDLYNKEHIENMGLSTVFEERLISNNTHVTAAAKERLNFWRDVIKKARQHGVLEEQFGEGGIRVRKKALTSEMANLSAEEFHTAVTEEALPEVNLVALGHIMRRYNAPILKSGKSEIRSLLYREIHMNNEKLAPNEVNMVVNEILAKITNKDVNIRNSAFEDLPAGVNFSKEREIAITDAVLSQADVIDHNVLLNELGSWKQLVAESELNRTAKEVGYEKWSDLIEEYQQKANQKIGSVIGEGEIITGRMSEIYNYNYALLRDTEKSLKGTFGKEDILHNNQVWKFINNSRGLAFISYAGNMPLSFITDGAAVVLRSSMSNALKRFILGIPNTIATRLSIPLEAIGSKLELPTLSNMGKWLKEQRTNDPELMQRAFGFIDRQIDETRFLVDLDSYTQGGKMQKLIKGVSKYSGLDAINKSLRNVTAQEIYSKLLTECIREEPDMKFLAEMSLTEEYRNILANDYKKFGTKNGTVRYLDPSDISNINVETAVRASVESLLNQSTLTPGIGNVPRYLRSSFGKMFYMFATYPYMIYNDIIRPALGGYMTDTPYIQAIGVSYALSITKKIMEDLVNSKEIDPDSIEFWDKVQMYSWTDFYMLDVVRKGTELLTNKYGRSVVDQSSPLLGFLNTAADMIGFKKSATGVRNRIPGVNFWWAKPITNPFLPSLKNRKRGSLR